MLHARNLSVSIGRTPIVSGVSLSARPGEVSVIVGPNGSGKTTLMKAVAGDLAYSGSVTLAGQEIARLRPHQQATLRAVLPQATSLSFPFTVFEVVRLGLLGGYSGVSAGELSRLPERALARVDLAGFAGRYYQELSGGEQQRVQLARVLCQVWTPVHRGQPRYLLLDEPVSSLDIKHQLTIMDIARDYAASGGGVVAILHDLNLAAMYADQLLVMHRGQAVAAGTPADVLTDRLLAEVFDCNLRVGELPRGTTPFVLPQTAAHIQANN